MCEANGSHGAGVYLGREMGLVTKTLKSIDYDCAQEGVLIITPGQ
jgi:hypothetical protein